ncbi:MAG: hypothetical protein KDB65_13130 [Calditrichaeota bacterium]|nr:hypothetical protein [Calditrichota bacterium]
MILLLLSGLLCPLVSFGQDSLNVTSVGTFWNFWDEDPYLEDGGDIAVSGTLAFLCTYRSGLRVIDFSDPANPIEVSFYQQSAYPYSYVYEVETSGNFAYLATSRGIRVLDFSDPANLVEANVPEVAPACEKLAIVGNHLLSARNQLLWSYDISDPHDIQFVESIIAPNVVRYLAADSNYFYVLTSSQFQVYEIGDSGHAEVIGYTNMWTDGPMTVTGEHAYVKYGDGFKAVDLEDPAHPVAGPVMLAGTYYRQFSARGNLLAGVNAFSGRLYLVDISDPDSIFQISSYYFPNYYHWPLDVELTDTAAYVKTWQGGLQMLDIRTPDSVEFIGGYNGNGVCNSLAMYGNQLLAANGRFGLHVVDMSDPHHPNELDTLLISDDCIGVAVQDEAAYAVYKGYGMVVLGLNEGAPPQVLGELRFNGTVESIEASENIVLLRDRERMTIVDVSTPSAPAILDTFYLDSTYTYFTGTDLHQAILYSISWRGLETWDMSVPTQPELLGRVQIENPTALTVANGNAYVVRGYYNQVDSTLYIIDVEDSRNPSVINIAEARPDTLSYPHCYNVEFRGGILFLHESRGMRLIDVSDPMNPYCRGYYHSNFIARSFAVQGQFACVGTDWNMRILDFSAALPGAVQLAPPQTVNITYVGESLFVRWDAITQDAFGRPVSPLYRVLGSTNPNTPPEFYSIIAESTFPIVSLPVNAASPSVMTIFVTAE